MIGFDEMYSEKRDRHIDAFIVNRLIRPLIRLLHRNLQADKRFACPGNTGDKADALVTVDLARLYYIQDVPNGCICSYLVRFVSCDILDGMTLI